MTAADFARRHAEEIINGRRLDLVDQLYAPDAIFHDPVAPGGVTHGQQEIKGFFTAIVAAIPDFHFDTDEVFGTEDRGVREATPALHSRGILIPLLQRASQAPYPSPRSFVSQRDVLLKYGSTSTPLVSSNSLEYRDRPHLTLSKILSAKVRHAGVQHRAAA